MNNDILNTSLLSNENFINQPYIITFFRSWGGGKLINHCLGLSSQVWFGDLNTAIIESNLTDKKLYDFKLQSCLQTIPENKNIDHKLWWNLEKGEIYGDSIMDLILKQKKYIPSVCHGPEQKFQKFFTIKKQSISAIELVNTDAFQTLCWNLKKVPEKLRDSTKFIIPFKTYKFDMNSIFFFENFMENIEQLYSHLGLSDFNANNVLETYVKSLRNWHNL